MGRRIVLGLRQQVGGEPFRIVVLVGDDEHLRRAGDGVDADDAIDLPLGGGDVGIAGADDLGNSCDCFGAVGERSHGLRAADAIDLRDASHVSRRQHQRVDLSVRRRHCHGGAGHTGHSGRDGIHEHRARVAGLPARHVEPDCFDGAPARAERGAGIVRELVVARQLAAVVRLDAIPRQLERIQGLPLACAAGRLDLRLAHADAGLGEVEPVELPRQLDEGSIAARPHLGNDAAHGHIDVLGRLALACEERRKRARKVAITGGDLDRHDASVLIAKFV